MTTPAIQPSSFKAQGSLLARNTLLNLIGQGLPLIVAIVAIPFTVHGLGTDRFGLLSLAWMVLGYFAIFDLGLGRATTKFVAEAFGKGQHDQVPSLVWTAVTIQLAFGILGALVLASITPLLVGRILNIPSELITEATDTFYLLSLSLPVVLVSSSFSGVLQAAQRFDLLNLVRLPSSTLSFLLPLVGLLLGFTLPGIVSLILALRLTELVVYVLLSIRILPDLKRYAASLALSTRIFSFGGWVTVSSVVGPILVYLDHFLIASLLSITAVAFYTVPYKIATQLWIIAGSLSMTLFPAFSALEAIKDRQKLGFLFARAVKYILLVLGPIVVIVALFAEEILQLWLGAHFAGQSAVVLQILALGVLINSLAFIPFALLQGAGRPDLPAKFHLLELPLYIPMVWFSINQWGIAGAAAAWSIRVAFDAALLFGAVFKLYQFSPRLFVANGTLLTGFALGTLAATTYGLKLLVPDLPLVVQTLLASGLVCLFMWFSWRYILDTSDRVVAAKLVTLRTARNRIPS